MTTKDQLKYSYWAFIFCIIISCVVQPDMVQALTMLVSSVMIVAFYALRRKKDKDTFEHKEFSFLIKTFWVWSAIVAIGILVAGQIVSSFGDMTALNEFKEGVMNGTITFGLESAKLAGEKSVEANWGLMISSRLACLVPAQIYAILRIKQGLNRLSNPPVTAPEAIIS